jgi:hypothetical protein
VDKSVSDINPPMIMDTIIPASLMRFEMAISFGVRASENVLKISNAVQNIEIAATPMFTDSHLALSSAHIWSR